MRIACLAACCALSSTARAQGDDRPVPPLSASRITGEVMLGTLAGLIGIVPGALIAYGTGCCEVSGDDIGLAPGIYGGYVGMTLLMPLGVYLAGTRGDETGSLSASYLGATIGGATGLLAFWLTTSTDAGETLEVGASLFALGAPLTGAILGFNLTREYDARQPAVPVVLVDRDRALVGVAGRW